MKLRILFLMVVIFAFTHASDAKAEKAPRAGGADSRIKFFTYSENDVYRFEGHYGYSTVIELSPNEIIESATIGDSEAWQIVRSGRTNILFVKPILENTRTNMTLITNKRMYSFDMSAKKTNDHHSSDLAFRVKFNYSNETDASLAYLSKSSDVTYDPFKGVDGDSFNFDYSYSGSKRLRPTKAFDDGVFTYLSFPKFETMPAVFEVQEDGSESLVNYNVKGQYLVVSSIGKQFTLRDGNTATCIFNDSYPKNTGKERKVVPIAQLPEKLIEATPNENKIVMAMNVPLPSKKPDYSQSKKVSFPKIFQKFANHLEPISSSSLNQ